MNTQEPREQVMKHPIPTTSQDDRDAAQRLLDRMVTDPAEREQIAHMLGLSSKTTAETDWHHCRCGQSLWVTDSDHGRAALAQWRHVHATHLGERVAS